MVGLAGGMVWGLALIREDRWRGIVGYTAETPGPPGAGVRGGPGAMEKAMIRSLTRLEARNRLRMPLALPAKAEARRTPDVGNDAISRIRAMRAGGSHA